MERSGPLQTMHTKNHSTVSFGLIQVTTWILSILTELYCWIKVTLIKQNPEQNIKLWMGTDLGCGKLHCI